MAETEEKQGVSTVPIVLIVMQVLFLVSSGVAAYLFSKRGGHGATRVY